MKVGNKIKGVAVTMALILSSASSISAALKFNDVTDSHWAYTAIATVAEKGIIVGDGVNYNPTQVINKFDTAKILARVAGYSIISDYTPKSSTTYVINQLKQQLPKTWGSFNKETENSIAYLYENNVFTVDNLTKLASKYSDESETINNLTKEEMAVFLVKALGLNEEAQAYKSSYAFSDDSSISENAKPYIYYLYSQKVISGDNENKFNPLNSITRAEMATLLYKSLYDDTPLTKEDNDQTDEEKPVETINVSSAEGKISRIYTSNIITIELQDGNLKVCKIKESALVYINSEVSSVDKLKEGMQVFAVIVDNEVSEIRVLSSVKEDEKESEAKDDKTAEEVDISTLSGKSYTVEYIKNINNENVIGVLVKTVTPSGDIEAEIQNFTIAQNCIMKKLSDNIKLSDIKAEDVVTLKIYNGKVYYIELEEKNAILKGATLTNKKLNASDVPVITVKAKDGAEYELKIVSASEIIRKGEGEIKWRELRIGDTLEIEKEYNTIISLYAEGSYSEVSGWVEEIKISEEYPSIVIRDSYGINREYRVSRAKILYGIKLGSKITAVLSSQEIEAVTVINEEDDTVIYGTVDIAKSSYMYVDKSSTASVRVDFDTNTKVYDAVSDKNVKISDLTDSMYVMVTFTNSSDNVAKKVTILSK